MENLENISYMIDEKGQKKYVMIPINLFQEKSFEDLYDVFFARHQLEKETFVPFE